MESHDYQAAGAVSSPFSPIVRRLFFPILILGQVWGGIAVALSVVWMNTYGGFDWTKGQVFNFHPVSLTIGMIFLYGEAIIVYRVLRCLPKSLLKFLHFLLHLISFLLAIFGLTAVFTFHSWNSIADLYSLHSWIGLASVCLYGIQLVASVGLYLLPCAPIRIRAMVMPFHRTFGMIMFGAVGATAGLGITEKAIFNADTLKCWTTRCPDAYIINGLGVSILIYVVSVLYLVITPEYKRPIRPSD